MFEQYNNSKARIEEFRSFVNECVGPIAGQIDREEHTSQEVIDILGDSGYLGAIVPVEYGGKGMDLLTYGSLIEEIGKASSAILSLFTVHGMFITALIQWGTESQKSRYLPKLASGEIIGAFALTEPKNGSDAKNLQTTAELSGDKYVINGSKKWISMGMVADVFLTMGMVNGKPTAFIVENDREGFTASPVKGMLGLRGSMLAELSFDDCKIPMENLVCREGFGFSHVAGVCLDYGRYCISWGALGAAVGCLEASLAYVKERKQFGNPISQYQLIKAIIADMETDLEAGRLLCAKAGYEKLIDSPESIMTTTKAKYFVSKILKNISNDAVQIHGANGCSDTYPVERYYRDAKVIEIIEGSNQMQQLMISGYAYQKKLIKKEI